MLILPKAVWTLSTFVLLVAGLAALWSVALPNGMAAASFILVVLMLGGFVVIARLNGGTETRSSLSRLVHDGDQRLGVPAPIPSPRAWREPRV